MAAAESSRASVPKAVTRLVDSATVAKLAAVIVEFEEELKSV